MWIVAPIPKKLSLILLIFWFVFFWGGKGNPKKKWFRGSKLIFIYFFWWGTYFFFFLRVVKKLVFGGGEKIYIKIMCPSKVCCLSLQILLFVPANFVVRPWKICRPTVQSQLCINANSIVRPCKWMAKTKKNICLTATCYHFWAKIAISEKSFCYWLIELSTFVNGSNMMFKQKRKK